MKKLLLLSLFAVAFVYSIKSIESDRVTTIRTYSALNGGPDRICVNPDVIMHFDFNDCSSFVGASSADYAEFVPNYVDDAVCGNIGIIGDHLYRQNSTENLHSCTPGIFNSPGMCVMAAEVCDFSEDDDQSIRVDFELSGKNGEAVIFSGLSFYEQAPLEYSWIQGMSGENNYPTKYGIRIVKDGEEVYRNPNLETSLTWNKELFDFTGIPAFTVMDTSIFEIELFPYCLSGIDSDVSVWDIDELSILSCCAPCQAIAGELTTADNTTICVNDGIPDVITYSLTGNVASHNLYMVTDAIGEIIIVSNELFIDFEPGGLGTCYIQNIAWEGDLVGFEEGNNICDVFGCYNLSTSIEVVRAQLEPTEISTSNETTFCSGDGIDDVVNVDVTGYISGYSSWVITDEAGVILDNVEPPYNFEGLASGNCLIYNVISTEMLDDAVIGLHVNDLQGCLKLSNSILITRNEINGGMISTMNSTSICLGNGTPNVIEVDIENAIGNVMVFAITNLDGDVLLTQDSTLFDFESSDKGSCLIWAISLSDSTFIPVVGSNIHDLAGCASLSNSIEITRSFVEPGSISTSSSTFICSGDEIPDIVDVDFSGSQGDSSVWLITDEMGLILDLPESTPFDFEGVPAGNCYIYSISYIGALEGLLVGQSIQDIGGCYALTDPILIEREEVNGGQISTSAPTTICSGDGIPDQIIIDIIDQVGAFSTYMVSDENGTIIELKESGVFDFEGNPSGISYISHVASSEVIPSEVIGTLLNDLEGCLSISNQIEVNRADVVENEIFTNDQTSICVGDGIDDLVEVTLIDNSQTPNTWIVTSEDSIVLNLVVTPVFSLRL